MKISRKNSIRIALATAWSAHAVDLRRHLPGALAGGEHEDLHQFRVALRKTRALLTLFRHIVPAAEPFRDDFKWLAAATGEARDLDVLSTYAQRQTDVSDGRQQLAAPILAELTRRRTAAQQKLRSTLESPRTRVLLDRWRHFTAALAGDSPDAPAPPELPPSADIPAWTAIEVLILKNSRKLLKEGVEIDAVTSAHTLHELRIRGKRLRYLLESFDLSAKADRVGTLSKRLRKLQTVLGEHQDAIVAAQHWQQLAATLRRRKSIAPGTFALLREWLAAAQTHQQTCRKQLPKTLKKFARACADL